MHAIDDATSTRMPSDVGTGSLALGPEQADALLKLLRVKVLWCLRDPASTYSVAAQLGEDVDRVKYHVDALARVGLIEEAGIRGGKRIYRACADSLTMPMDLCRPGGPDASGGDAQLIARMIDGLLKAPHDARSTTRHAPATTFTAVCTATLRTDAPRYAFLFAELEEAFRAITSKYSDPELAATDEHAVQVVLTCRAGEGPVAAGTTIQS
ncbi:MAG: ArsR family transcriptional regulator [Acidimicrobiales bacterium]|jgi:hypothetical protein|nr:ArsR family transcriptional regulator [Acidimicrobiales bacterium]